MKALDIVITPKGVLAIVQETIDGGEKASIRMIGGQAETGERVAWWEKGELTVVDSIPRMLSIMSAHPFGSGGEDVFRSHPLS